MVPWEVTTPLKIAELVNTHTRFSGNRSLCVGTVRDRDEQGEVRKPAGRSARLVIDANSGARDIEVGRQGSETTATLRGLKRRRSAATPLSPSIRPRPSAGALRPSRWSTLWIKEMKAPRTSTARRWSRMRAPWSRYAGPATGEHTSTSRAVHIALPERDRQRPYIAFDDVIIFTLHTAQRDVDVCSSLFNAVASIRS